MRMLVFDIWGDFAHFRKFFTTSSPLTQSFPPPPTIAGMLGAIIGSNKLKNEYLRSFLNEESFISIQIIVPIKKIRFGLNFVETKGSNLRRPFSDKSFAPRTQIRTEFLRSPRFRIFFTHRNTSLYKQVFEFVSQHKTFYTLSLGLSELIANFEYIGEFEYENKTCKTDEFVEIVTPVITSNLNTFQNSISFEPYKKYLKEKIPIKMTPDRIVTKYDEAIFDPDGKSIFVSVKNYQKLSDDRNITFF